MRNYARNIKKHFFAFFVISCMLLLLAGCGKSDSKKSEEKVTTNYGLADNIKDGTILQCFSWSFETIKESIPDIAAAGFSAIQTSPINACYDGGNAGMELSGDGKWSYHYQPIDWKIGNYQLGSRSQFKEMCDKAKEYGIKVIVDVTPNHTTKNTSAVSKDLIDAVGGIDKLYHSNGKTSIENYKDRKQCTLEAVGGLPDVNTENKQFQDYFINYLDDCITCGASGFRYDTAKHIGLPDDPQDNSSMPNNFWTRVITEVKNADTIFNYGEVLQDGGERIKDYIKTIGATTASTYGKTLRNAIAQKKLSEASLDEFEVGGSSDVVTWVESHDTYIGGDATYLSCTNDEIILGWSVIAARKLGTPLFFSRPYGNTKENKWGTMNRIGLSGDLFYRDKTVTAVNRFRNAMIGEEENLYNCNGNESILCIARGKKGLVLVNVGAKQQLNIPTVLDDGTYVNRVDGTTQFEVSDGQLTGSIEASSVVVLYNEGYLEIGTTPVVKVADGESEVFYTDTTEVTLKAENSVKSTYSVNDGKEVSYKDGDKLTISANSGDIIKVKLYGESSDGLKSVMTYEFSHKTGTSSGTKIYFKKPDSWEKDICAYVYDETSGTELKINAKWPGVAMNSEGDNIYSYTFTEDWVAPLVIFTDGKNQSNGEMEPGEKVVADKTYETRK